VNQSVYATVRLVSLWFCFLPHLKKNPVSIGCSFKFPVKVGVEESVVNTPLV
jgi:hypothetical protein